MKKCSEEELDFLLMAANKEGHDPLHHMAIAYYTPSIRSLLRGVRERGWRGEEEQEEWRNGLDDDGLTALHLAIAFSDGDDPRLAAEVVEVLLWPLEGEGGAEEQQQRDDEEEQKRRRRERMYVGGLDPNKKCSKRTGVYRLLDETAPAGGWA
jgi:hypothetical protein